MSDIDRAILTLLQSNGKLTMQEIADSIGGISKVAVSYRIKRLEESGMIEGYYAKVNPEKVRRGYIFISRATCKFKGRRETEIAKKISELQGVQSVYGIFGDFDLVLIGRAENKEEAKKLLDRVNSIPGVNYTNTIVAHTVIKESLAVDIPSTSGEEQGESAEGPEKRRLAKKKQNRKKKLGY